MARRKLNRAEAAEERASLLGLGRAVTQLRAEAGATRHAVAMRGGLTGNTITHIEKGLKKEPRWATVRCLAKGLNVTVEDLVKRSLELAPGPAGDRLRKREEEARKRLRQVAAG